MAWKALRGFPVWGETACKALVEKTGGMASEFPDLRARWALLGQMAVTVATEWAQEEHPSAQPGPQAPQAPKDYLAQPVLQLSGQSVLKACRVSRGHPSRGLRGVWVPRAQ
jgi:hypothetical protein